jgi:hypothetical protein
VVRLAGERQGRVFLSRREVKILSFRGAAQRGTRNPVFTSNEASPKEAVWIPGSR